MECPAEDDLISLAEGGLETVSPELEGHLDGCLRCREAIIALAGTNDAPFDLGPDPGLWATVVREAEGRYEELGVCGHGGQSIVLRVRDRHLSREVALKEFRQHSRSRFAREVRVVGGLSHPAIVPLLEVGIRDNDAPYYTMPLVRGGTLASAVLETEGVARRLRLLPHVVMVCQAMAHAHSRGVLHRDLKPANVMVGEFGETLVIDWGLAKVLGAGAEPPRPEEDVQQSESKTMHGAAIGTPAYMSPEQATGDLDNIDERSEVWSLGAMLAFILTKKPPFSGNSSNEILIAVASGTRDAVIADDGKVPPELAAVVERAMAFEKKERYPSAVALAEELIAFQSGGLVSAYRYSASERVIRFLSRHRSLLLAGVSVLLSLAVGLALALRSYRNEAAAREDTVAALADAEAAKESEREQRLAASFNLAAAYVAKAERLRDKHELLEATHLAARSLQLDATYEGSPLYDAGAHAWLDDSEHVQARALSLLLRAEHDPVVGLIESRVAPGHIEGEGAAFSATEGGGRFIVSRGGEVAAVHDLRTGSVVAELGGHDTLGLVSLSRTGKTAVTADTGGVVRVWSLPEGELRETYTGVTVESSLDVSDPGAVIGVDNQGSAILVPSPAGEPRPLTPELVVLLGSFSTDGRLGAVGTKKGEVSVFDVETGEPLFAAKVLDAWVTSIVFAADNRRLVVSGSDGRIVVRDLTDPEAETRKFQVARAPIMSMSLSDDGEHAFAAFTDGRVRMVRMADGASITHIPAPAANWVSLDEEAGEVVTIAPSELRRWELRPQPQRRRHDAGLLFRRAMGRLWKGTMLLPAHEAGGVLTWSMETGEQRLHRIPEVGAVLQMLPMGGPHEGYVSTHEGGTVVWWEPGADGVAVVRRRWTADPLPIALSRASDGSAIVVRGPEQAVWVLDPESSEPAATLQGHERGVLSSDFTPDGRWLATGSVDEVLIWSMPSMELDATLLPNAFVGVVEFAAGGTVLVTAGQTGLNRFEVGTWKPLPPLTEARQVRLASAPTGPLVASQGSDRFVTVWDAAAGERKLELRSESPPRGFVFTEDGQGLWLVYERHLQLHPLDPSSLERDADRLVADAERRLGGEG